MVAGKQQPIGKTMRQYEREDTKMNNNATELTLDEMENVNGAGVAEFFKELLECLLDGATHAD